MEVLHEDQGVLAGPRAARRLWPFFVAFLVAVAAAPLTDGGSDYPLLLAAVAVLLVVTAAVPALPWSRWPRRAQAVPPMLLFVVVAFLREGAGGSRSGYATLVLLPILWLALYGDRLDLALAATGMILTLSARSCSGLPRIRTPSGAA